MPAFRLRQLIWAFCLAIPLLSAAGSETSALGHSPEHGPRSVGDVFQKYRRLHLPEERRQAVEGARRIMEARRAEARARAAERGLPARFQAPDGAIHEIMDFDEGGLLYAITLNRDAAISTAADRLLPPSIYGVDGGGFTVGVWDAGAVRSTHEALTGRVTLRDNVAPDDHATLVGGTIAARPNPNGPNAHARGMAPAVRIDSYDWSDDIAEMTARGAAFPGEDNRIYISNHSYGFLSGWDDTGEWEWFGGGTTAGAVEERFGRYSSHSHDLDSLLYNLPYYTAFWAAGNDRDNNPTDGQTVIIGGQTVIYNSSLHPPGDGVYRGGYDTLSFASVAKNPIVIGAVNAAVLHGVRNLSRATMTAFSSWGPTDDGRIKPDLVAVGTSLYSTRADSDTAYGWASGTSMATPNASGSAQLVVSYFARLFPGRAMRAGTLRALLIHTADDLGAPGPDYRFGWGLLNAEAAAEKIRRHSEAPATGRMVESQLMTGSPAQTHSFTWDGVSPIRVTIAWTDPPALATTTHDNRATRLVNNLNLVVRGPDGLIFQPWVMPFVGAWTQASLSAPATTGNNNTDNVEQVFIEQPAAPGVYTATVSFGGALTNGHQVYSLIISGAADRPNAPASISGIQPDTPTGTTTTIEVFGGGFQLGATLRIERPGFPTVEAWGIEKLENRLRARLNTEGLAGGAWDVVVVNADGIEARASRAFRVPTLFWTDNIEEARPGWSNRAEIGITGWRRSTTRSRSPTHSWFAPGPSSRARDELYSPAIPIPAGASDFVFSFWHRYNFQSGLDGGVLEIWDEDRGGWFDVTLFGHGVYFITGGYTIALSGGGNPNLRNPLVGRQAWSGIINAFSEVAVRLSAEKFAGRNLRVRWLLGTDNNFASEGWHIDDVSLRGIPPPPVPSLLSPATADEAIVTGASVILRVNAVSPDGDQITYSWTVNDTHDFPVSFSDNGTPAAHTTTATFRRAGTYRFEATARNNSQQAVSSSVEVIVKTTASSLLLTPDKAVLQSGGALRFAASVEDQFGLPFPDAPAITWSVDPAAGAIDNTGLFTAGGIPGQSYELRATIGNLSGSAMVTIRGAAWGEWLTAYFTAAEINDPGISAPLADPDGDGVANLLEYAIGGDPRLAGSASPPAARIEILGTSDARLVLEFTRPAALPDVVYTVEASSDFINWAAIPAEIWEIAPDGAGREHIRAPDPEPLAAPTRFLRLAVRIAQ